MTKYLLAMGAALIVASVASGCQSDSKGVTKVDAPVAKSSPKAKATAKKVTQWGDGVYKVGKEIQPGQYETKGNDSGCMWERLKGTSGDLSDVLANDIVTGPGKMTVKSGDKYIKFSLGCAWRKSS